MKILIVRTYPNYMNVENRVYNIQEVGLAKALIRNGHKCDIIFWCEDKNYDHKIIFDEKYSLTIYYRKGINFIKNAIYTDIDEILKDYDIIQTGEYSQIESWLISRKYPKKTVVYNGPYYSKFNKKFNLICKIFDLFFLKTYIKNNIKFITKSNLSTKFLANKGIDDNNIFTCGVGIDTDSLKSKSCCDDKKFSESIDKIYGKRKIKLLYIGKIEPRRNITFIYDVIKELRNYGYDIKLIMIGDGDKNYIDKCNLYSKKLNIEDAIYRFPAIKQEQLSEVYKKADFFLLPTHYEIFGMVLIEAMYYGLPVITTENGGSDILIDNNKNSIILELDKKMWCKKIINLIENKKHYIEMSERAKNNIKENFTWDSISISMINVYKELLKNENIDG